MECPSESFLELFVQDPDAALVDSPSFEEHLAECKECQLDLDELAIRMPRLRHLEMVIGHAARTTHEYPELEGYKFHELIGAGGFGAVYRATHLETGRPVAIKIIRPLDAVSWKRISLERDTLIRADHPNIVPYWISVIALHFAFSSTDGWKRVFPSTCNRSR